MYSVSTQAILQQEGSFMGVLGWAGVERERLLTGTGFLFEELVVMMDAPLCKHTETWQYML